MNVTLDTLEIIILVLVSVYAYMHNLCIIINQHTLNNIPDLLSILATL